MEFFSRPYLYTALTTNDLEIGYVMFWSNSNNSYYVPTPTNANATDFVTFTNKSKSVLKNTLPNMYVLP